MITVVITAVLMASWMWTPLGDIVTLESLSHWVESISSRPWTPVLLVLLYVPASLLTFPRQILSLAAIIVYGPWKGFVIIMVGAQLATVLQYYAGRMFARERVKAMAGTRFERVSRMLRTRGLAAVTAVRLLPLGPFPVMNALAGAMRVRVRDLTLGTFLGMLPGTIATTIVGDQLAAGMAADRAINPWVIGGAIVGVVLVMALSWSWYKRLTS